MNVNTLERVLARITLDENGCWNWPGATYQGGYGQVRSAGRGHATHRVTYSLMVTPIPPGLHIDHLCRNRACCNPDHLEPVTQAVNTQRGARGYGWGLAMTHCKRGHEMTEANVYTAPSGARSCRTCNKARQLEYARRKRDELGVWASTARRRRLRATLPDGRDLGEALYATRTVATYPSDGTCPGGDR